MLASSPQPPSKKKIQRLRTGCWTCRKRGYKCDEGKPECNNCMRMKKKCGGYNIRLKWPEDRQRKSASGSDESVDGSVPRSLLSQPSPPTFTSQSPPQNATLQEVQVDDSCYTPGVSRSLQHVLRLEPSPPKQLSPSPVVAPYFDSPFLFGQDDTQTPSPLPNYLPAGVDSPQNFDLFDLSPPVIGGTNALPGGYIDIASGSGPGACPGPGPTTLISPPLPDVAAHENSSPYPMDQAPNRASNLNSSCSYSCVRMTPRHLLPKFGYRES